MSWFRVDGNFPLHPKVVECSLAAIGLWVKAGAWAAESLTDGHVPAKAVVALGATRKHAMELAESGLWVVDARGGWSFHDWHLYQPDADSERARRSGLSAKRAEAGRKGAAARWQTDGKHDGKRLATAWQDDGPEPEPEPDSYSRTDQQQQRAVGETPAAAAAEGFDDARISPAIGLLVDLAERRARESGRAPNHPMRWRAKVRAARAAEDGPQLAELAAQHPEWTPKRLAAQVAGCAELELTSAPRGYL